MNNDYETYPLKRIDIRMFAKIIRIILGIDAVKLPILDMLDILESKFGVLYSIEEDSEFKRGVVAKLEVNDGTYSIHLRNSVYENACEGEGSSLGFICHEMCHYFLIKWFGYGPIYGRTIKNEEIPPYKSMEWQAKALCGELMIPYKEFSNSNVEEVIRKTGSSYEQAKYFTDIVQKKIDI